MFGKHLMLDMYGCDKEKLDSLDVIWNLLNKIPDMIGMHKITQPYVFTYEDANHPDKYGISGVVIIAESHISIHTFPEKQFATIDVYSCRDFEDRELIDYLIKELEADNYEKRFQIRGKNYDKKKIVLIQQPSNSTES